MTYASVADLKSTIPPRDLELLSDFEGEADAPVDARLMQALSDASAEIDGYIAKQVNLPLADPPHVLNVICRDLAMWRLYRNLGHASERVSDLHDTATAWLRDLADGKVALGDDDTPAQPTSGGVAMTDGPDRLFTRDSLKGF